MGRKSKYTFEQKLKAVEEYISGKKSAAEIATELSMGKRGRIRVREWANRYRENGQDILLARQTNTAYSKEFKTQVVEEYLRGSDSLNSLVAKYGIRSTTQICDWISKYNSYEELRDYDPHPEVYMAKRRKTTLEERKEIVEYCLEHNKDYKGTALKYDCSYSQVYQWVRNYEADGADGLKDNRGKRRQEKELSETEKLQRRIKQLERELLQKERENELLKKVDEFERRWLKDFQKPDGSQ
ncbi:MAG: helix-turn-helix domain-containing protein [Oscillospiraceae bacterium]|nr:helix-turn-helix domain-containing protein [Oscillospiraceae bacterium]